MVSRSPSLATRPGGGAPAQDHRHLPAPRRAGGVLGAAQVDALGSRGSSHAVGGLSAGVRIGDRIGLIRPGLSGHGAGFGFGQGAYRAPDPGQRTDHHGQHATHGQ